ncbi:MAG: sensory histidine kinase AtoS [Methanoregula sp. PtaU1.Bin051]|nr:MAG: sensory histidine kinase AtoS [Methanoregula sp. PtaU1.Bin051]
MNLQERTILTFVILLIALISFVSIFISITLLSSYTSVEKDYALRDLHQTVSRLNEETLLLSAIAGDWATWDDTYDYASGKRPEFIQSSLIPDTYNNFRLNVFIITDRQGRILHAGAYDLSNHTMTRVPQVFMDQLTKDNPLLSMGDPRHATAGIIMLPQYPVMVASKPIVRSDYSGTPQGVVIVGRYIDSVQMGYLSAITQPSLEIIPVRDPSVDPALLTELKSADGSNPEIVRSVSGDAIAGYALVSDIYGNDAFVLQITQPRDIYRQGLLTTFQFILIILGAGLIFGLVILYFMDRYVLSRIGALGSQVRAIGRNSDFSRRVIVAGDDELAGLETEINRLLDNIERSQHNLQDSEARFRDMSDLLPQIVFEMDTSGKLTYINKFGMDTFGLSDSDLAKGLQATQFIISEDVERMQKNLATVASGGKSPGEIYTFTKNDGSKMRAMALTAPIVTNGTVTGFRGSVIDISDRLNLEEALEQREKMYRTLTENTPDIIFSTDLDGRVTYISPQINQYGFLSDEITGRHLSDYIHVEDRQQVKETSERDFSDGARFTFTFRIPDKWGNIHWFEEKSYLQLDPFGKPFGIFGMLRDITERRRAEDAIALANKKLNLMNNITRHDILNTITGLFGCVDMAKATTSVDERALLLQDIRDLAKVIQRQITFTKDYQEIGVNLPRWQNVNDVIGRILVNFQKSEIRFLADLETIEVYADPLLEKVFYNLVDNAIRYGKRVTNIRFFFLISDKGLSLICEDDGIGIENNMKNYIFERGVGQNTGMGLFLSREILAITQIEIVENGTYGKGARFEMVIPRGAFRFGRKQT